MFEIWSLFYQCYCRNFEDTHTKSKVSNWEYVGETIPGFLPGTRYPARNLSPYIRHSYMYSVVNNSTEQGALGLS